MKHNIKQKFIPGSEWAYFKVYVSPVESNTILIKYIYPLVLKLLSKKYIDNWFFIRYTDPKYHLRVRIHLIDIKYWNEIIGDMYSKLRPLIKSGLIAKVIIDTYVRELERYGHKTMELCESFFCADSEATCQTIKGTILKGQNINWRHGIIATDSTLRLFFDNINDRLNIISRISDSYNFEFGFDSNHLKQINSLYRKYRNDIEDVLYFHDNLNIKYKNFAHKNLFLRLKSEEIDKILPSLLHMNMNRLFSIRQRMYELIIYNFLKIAYKGMIARDTKTLE